MSMRFVVSFGALALVLLQSCLAYAPVLSRHSSLHAKTAATLRTHGRQFTANRPPPPHSAAAATSRLALRFDGGVVFLSSLRSSASDDNSDDEEDRDGETLYSEDIVDRGASNDSEEDEEAKKQNTNAGNLESISDPERTKGGGNMLSKVKSMFSDKSKDGLTTRQRLAKMGMSALLSYGWVSNMSYSVAVSLAWYGFSKKTGLSPLAPGQWKPFLAVYAGFYVFNNIVRPIRFGLSVAVSRYFDNAVAYIQRKTKLSRSFAIGLMVFLANFCGTLAAMSLGILLASMASGVPIFPSKV